MIDGTTDDRSMGDAFRSATGQNREEQLAQIETYLAHMAAQGYDRIEGPILQAVKAIAQPGRREEMLDILRKFRPIASGEEGTVFYGHFPDVENPDVIHSIQVYENWDALCRHMRDARYLQFIDPIMSISAPGSPEYTYGSCLFYLGRPTPEAGD